MEIEIGRGKKARRAYGFDDIAIVPSQAHARPRRHRHLLEARALPVRAADDGLGDGRRRLARDRRDRRAPRRPRACSTSRAYSPATRMPRISSSESHHCPRRSPRARCRRSIAEPIKPELISRRIAEIKEQKVVVAASLTPAASDRVSRARDGGRASTCSSIQGTVVSGEHVSTRLGAAEPEGVHPDARRARRRRRLRLLPHGPAPDAHGRGRGARRRRPRRGVHDARRARHRRSAGDRDRGRRPRARHAHARDRASTAR